MTQTNYLKLFAAFAFVAFAAVSCWATVESLHLLLPSIPIIFVWILTVGFFFIASWGSKMIVDSLNKNVYTENPGMTLCGGIVIMLIFWLICSMPTNTHTFYYRNVIKDVAINDLTKAEEYLHSLQDDDVAHLQIEQDWAKYESEVRAIQEELRLEANNPSRPGMAEHFENIMLKLDAKLGEKVGRISPRMNTIKGWNDVLEQYNTSINNILANKKVEYAKKYVFVSDKRVKSRINKLLKNISIVMNDIHNMDGIKNDVIINASKVLSESSSLIGQYADNVKFNEGDKDQYTGKTVSKTDRMLSVWDVWMDFLTGKQHDLKFIFWIVIAILVDVAGFIFFDLAFHKTN